MDESSDNLLKDIKKRANMISLDIMRRVVNNQPFSDFPVDNTLSVIPTEGESQFESYQSIIAKIMSANINPLESIDDLSPYEILCSQNDIELSTDSACKQCIYFEPSESTHYIAKKDRRVLDPYKYYQLANSQGFCQMYAYFLYINDIDGFLKITKPINLGIDSIEWVLMDRFTDFVKLVVNNYVCLRKIALILRTNLDVKKMFKKDFDTLDKKFYGIKPRTTFNRFVDDLDKLTPDAVAYYLYDQFMSE